MNIRSCSPIIVALLATLPAVFAQAQFQQQRPAQPQSQAYQKLDPEKLILNEKQYFERPGIN
ncbi:MAG: hypothetical protein J6W70_03850, partial [Lentisphaeria bacterium]|nr:hypothetical protein [Lentisphaeria bacterium]